MMQQPIPTVPTLTVLSQRNWSSGDSELWRDCTPRPANAQEALLYLASIHALVEGLVKLTKSRPTA